MRVISVREARTIRPSPMNRAVADETPIFARTSPKCQALQGPVRPDVIFDFDEAICRTACQSIPVKNDSTP